MKKPKNGDPTTDASEAAPNGKAIKLTVAATVPLWRGPPGWDKHWPAGETIVEGEELQARPPELVEAMIACLEGDSHFSVRVEREKAEG